MLGERQDRGKSATAPGLIRDITQKLLMAEVKSVEIPKRENDGP